MTWHRRSGTMGADVSSSRRRCCFTRDSALASILALLLVGLLVGAAPALADTSEGEVAADSQADPVPSAQGLPLTIATRHVPPFAIRGADGSWSGIAIELWGTIADELGVEVGYTEMGLAQMQQAVADGDAYAAVAALTITPEREGRLDFSHPFMTSGLGVAVHARPGGGIGEVFKRFLSGKFLGLLASLLALLTITGALVWLAERRHNAQFQKHAAKGIGSGIWWSAVTMTTVGYGDKAPVTLLGRVLALIWMFAGIIMISGFTAAMTTALTVGELEDSVTSVQGLYGKRVATVAESTSADFLAEHGVRHRALGSLDDALADLAAKEADAVVFDAPMLRWEIAEQYSGVLKVLPLVLRRQDYGIALPQKSLDRERINTLLLEALREDEWPRLLERYLGGPG